MYICASKNFSGTQVMSSFCNGIQVKDLCRKGGRVIAAEVGRLMPAALQPAGGQASTGRCSPWRDQLAHAAVASRGGR
jgi:hypothetical protein